MAARPCAMSRRLRRVARRTMVADGARHHTRRQARERRGRSAPSAPSCRSPWRFPSA
jgi:hypothetical protein